MEIREQERLTNHLDICKNCEWAIQMQDGFLKCLLTSEIKGLTQTSKNFKRKTGNHVSV